MVVDDDHPASDYVGQLRANQKEGIGCVVSDESRHGRIETLSLGVVI